MRRIPFFKLLALVQILLLARHHLNNLSSEERRRMAELARHAHRLSAEERRELRELAAKLEPGAFAKGAAARMSPIAMRRARRR